MLLSRVATIFVTVHVCIVTGASDTCEVIIVKTCQSPRVSHKYTRTPITIPAGPNPGDGFNTYRSQVKALGGKRQYISRLRSAENLACKRVMRPFVCAALLPSCEEASPEPIRPCRDFCLRTKAECEQNFAKLGLDWPPELECSLFPTSLENPRCISEINECAQGLFFCPGNSTCRNIPGTYQCVFPEGFLADGQTAVTLDPRTCADEPCFREVECIGVDLATLDWSSSTTLKSFACGECPEGYVGDGENCKKPKGVNLTVTLIDAARPRNPLIDNAKLTAYVTDKKEGTKAYSSARTGMNGIANINVPHSKSLIIGIEHTDYLSKSESYKAYLSQNNSLTVELFTFQEFTEFLWRSTTTRAIQFENDLRVDIPQGSLQLRNMQRVSIECRVLNLTLIDAPKEGPELIAGIKKPETGEVELRSLEVFGMVELKVLVRNRRGIGTPPGTLRPFTIYTSVSNLPEDLDVPVEVWRYREDKGYWISEGIVYRMTDVRAPYVAQVRKHAMWQFEAQNFTYSWWAFGRVWEQMSCVTVRACYDADCVFPVANALIELYGIDFRYTVSRYTGLNGAVCFPYKTGGRVVVSAPSLNKQIQVHRSERWPPSNCGSDENQSILTPSRNVSDGNCAEEVVLFREWRHWQPTARDTREPPYSSRKSASEIF